MTTSLNVGFRFAVARGFRLTARAGRVIALGAAAQLASALLGMAIATAAAAVVMSNLGALAPQLPLLAAVGPERAGRLLAIEGLDGPRMVPVVGAAAVAGLLALALRLLWFAAAARTFGDRLEGRAAPGVVAAAASRLHRALPLLALLAPVALAVLLYEVTSLGATWLAFVAALNGHGGPALGAASAAGLALAAVIGFALSKGLGLFVQLALIEAIGADRAPLAAMRGAGATLGSRLGSIVGVALLFGALQLLPGLAVYWGAALALGAGAATESVAAAVLVGAFAWAVAAALATLLGTAEIGALATLDAGQRGTLPHPPPLPVPPPALPTEPVLGTEAIELAEAVAVEPRS